MRKSSDIEMAPTSSANHPQTPTQISSEPSFSARTNQHSMIGKSITIKGEIVASDPLYILGSVEGAISAPGHRVTVGNEGKVMADINAREVLIMGEVCGSVDGADRVEIRKDGSLIGNLAALRICIEYGAILKGIFDVCTPVDKTYAEAHEEPYLAFDRVESTAPAELKLAGD